MNPIIDSLKSRRSCRKFKSQMPPKELIEQVCEAGIYAPTGHGKQSPRIIVVTNRALRDRLSQMNAAIWGKNFDPFYGAPVVLIVIADRKIWTAEYDGCAVISNLLNAAHAVGLGSCWINRAKEEFDSPEGKQILKDLGLEGDYVGVGHCALGYADGELPPAMTRKADYVVWAE